MPGKLIYKPYNPCGVICQTDHSEDSRTKLYCYCIDEAGHDGPHRWDMCEGGHPRLVTPRAKFYVSVDVLPS
jgi:hypothetical protein